MLRKSKAWMHILHTLKENSGERSSTGVSATSGLWPVDSGDAMPAQLHGRATMRAHVDETQNVLTWGFWACVRDGVERSVVEVHTTPRLDTHSKTRV